MHRNSVGVRAGNDVVDEDFIGRGSDVASQLLRAPGSPSAGDASTPRASAAGGADFERPSFRCEAGASEDAAAFRLGRHLRKKLQQIEALERRRDAGGALDEQQANSSPSQREMVLSMYRGARSVCLVDVRRQPSRIALSHQRWCNASRITASTPQHST
jgi:hypothetical protein